MSETIPQGDGGQLPNATTETQPGITDPTAESGASETPEPRSEESPSTVSAREWQARYGRDTHPLRKHFGPNYDPIAVDKVLDKLGRAAAHPEIRKIIDRYNESGVFESQKSAPANGTTEEDPYESPTEKALREQLAAANQRIDSLAGSTARVAVATATDRLVGLTNRFVAKYPLEAKEQQLLRDKVQTGLGNLLQNNPDQFMAMTDDDFRRLAIGLLDDVVPIHTLGQRVGAQNGQARAERGTDPPLRALTNGQERTQSPEVKVRSRADLQKLFREKWAEAERAK